MIQLNDYHVIQCYGNRVSIGRARVLIHDLVPKDEIPLLLMASLTATPGSMHMSLDGVGNPPPIRGPSGRIKPLRRTLSHQTSPSTSASIPSRYQTFFYANTESKGFNSQATRFADHLNIEDNPGPGTYRTEKKTLERNSTSFSKKGTGGFASKCKRFSRERSLKLGPGSYNPQPINNRQDFNKAPVGSNFQTPIAVKPDSTKESKLNPLPAPNSYNLSGVHTGKNNLITAEAAFKSRTKRDTMGLLTAKTPAPCHYTIHDQLLHPSTCPHRSVFESKSSREGALGRPPQGPGPADYSPAANLSSTEGSTGAPKVLPYYRQKHYLCISAPALPLPPLPPSPGPGHYETHDKMTVTDTDEKKLVSGAVFKSTTSRWISNGSKLSPGPGSYNPEPNNKKSYLYNLQKKWI